MATSSNVTNKLSVVSDKDAVKPKADATTVAAPEVVEYADLDAAELYLNRELTWLEFNRRVLHEAQDESNPLLERLKFVGIVSANLDEIKARLDCIDIHEDILWAESFANTVVNPTGPTGRVLASVTNEYARHNSFTSLRLRWSSRV